MNLETVHGIYLTEQYPFLLISELCLTLSPSINGYIALTKDKSNGSGWLLMAKIEEKMSNEGLVGLLLRRGIECAPRDTELYRALAKHEISRGKIDSVRDVVSCLLHNNQTSHLPFIFFNVLRHGNY